MMMGTVLPSLNATQPQRRAPARHSLPQRSQRAVIINYSVTVIQCLTVNQVVAIHFQTVRMLVVLQVVDVRMDTFGSTVVQKKTVNVFHGMTVITLQQRHPQHQQPRQRLLRRQPQSRSVLSSTKFGTVVQMLLVWLHVKILFQVVVEMIINALNNVCVKWEP